MEWSSSNLSERSTSWRGRVSELFIQGPADQVSRMMRGLKWFRGLQTIGCELTE